MKNIPWKRLHKKWIIFPITAILSTLLLLLLLQKNEEESPHQQQGTTERIKPRYLLEVLGQTQTGSVLVLTSNPKGDGTTVWESNQKDFIEALAKEELSPGSILLCIPGKTPPSRQAKEQAKALQGQALYAQEIRRGNP